MEELRLIHEFTKLAKVKPQLMLQRLPYKQSCLIL